MKTHVLKCWPVYFERMLLGTKRFEIRNNDRDFQVGDHIILEEWNPTTSAYTHAKQQEFIIEYILHNHDGLYSGYVIMSLSLPLLY